jgi:hypothetical protein
MPTLVGERTVGADMAAVERPRDLWRRRGRWLRGWRGRLVAGLAAVVVLAGVAVLVLNPHLRYRSVSVDGGYGGCYRVYRAPVDLGWLLRKDRDQEPFVVVYQPPAQPTFTSLDLPAEREVVAVLADGSVLPSFSIPAHAGPGFYRQLVRPVGMVVVYYRSHEPPGGLPAKSFRVGGACPVDLVPVDVITGPAAPHYSATLGGTGE